MADPMVYDVAVVGGGTAGVAAATAAAAGGARVCLVERASALGGNARQALVHTICGLYLSAEEGDAVPANAGFANRFAADLQTADAAGVPTRAGRVWYLPVSPEGLARHARKLCEGNARVDLRLGCRLEGARAPENTVDRWQLALMEARGPAAVEATLLLDCSGDAAAAHLAGAATSEESGELLQHPSYIFRLDGVDAEALDGLGSMQLSHAVASAARRGELGEDCGSVVFRGGLGAGQVFVTLKVPKLRGRVYAPLNDDYRADLEAAARIAATDIVEHLRRSRPAFQHCRVDAWPERMGIRETRRVQGRVELTRDDVLTGRQREDEVARSSWPIELWNERRRARLEVPEGPCSLPLGSLVSRSHPRLGMAGRCMAGTHEALGAFRVLGTALATGEAVGAAAALAVDQGLGLPEIKPDAVRARIAAQEDSD